MARTAITIQTIARAGITPSYAAANASGNGGNSIANDGSIFLHVKNGGGSPINVTLAAPVDGASVGSVKTIAVANGAEAMIGPFPTQIYNQTDGAVYIDYSGVTSVTVAAFKLTPNV